MSATINTGSFAKALRPGVKKWWGQEYDKHEEEWSQLFDTETSDKAYEEVVESVGFGLAQVKAQGGGITFDTSHQGATTRFTHVAYAKGFIVTWEEMRDNLYMEVAKRRTPDMAFSMLQTKERVLANHYNRAFNSAYAGGDGVELCSSSHPTDNGNQSNILASGADLTEASLEALDIQIDQALDSRGRNVAIKGMCLAVPPALKHEAYRILKSINQNDTANNAVNALRASGAFPEGIKVNHYFTSDTAYFIRTNRRNGMTVFNRDPLMLDDDNEFSTKNLRYSAYERYSGGWGDWRGTYASSGV